MVVRAEASVTKTEILFPRWANEALLNDKTMSELWHYVQKQVEANEPSHKLLMQNGSYCLVSSNQNAEEYKSAVADRVMGELNSFFGPVLQNRVKIALGRCSKVDPHVDDRGTYTFVPPPPNTRSPADEGLTPSQLLEHVRKRKAEGKDSKYRNPYPKKRR